MLIGVHERSAEMQSVDNYRSLIGLVTSEVPHGLSYSTKLVIRN